MAISYIGWLIFSQPNLRLLVTCSSFVIAAAAGGTEGDCQVGN